MIRLHIGECGGYGWNKKKCGKWYMHNNNGPAIETVTGLKAYYVNGIMHRLDGPARIHNVDGSLYYIEGNVIKDEFEYWLSVQKFVDKNPQYC